MPWVLALLLVVPDAPRAVSLWPEETGSAAVAAAPTVGGVPQSLAEARRLAVQLRYEEAVVEYQRYLGLLDRPLAERANALLEVGFIHLVLGDDTNAEARALAALELDPSLSVPDSAPPKQVEFLARVKKRYLSRARVVLQPRRTDDPPALVRVTLADPEGTVKRVQLRHALAQGGPYYSTEMRCEGDACEGAIPPPKDATSYTAWYFVEANTAANLTAAKVGAPEAPLQLVIVNPRPWYASPVTWGVAGAVVVATAAVAFLLAPQAQK